MAATDDHTTTTMDVDTSVDIPMEDEGPPRRLIITKMELTNFKSYAGTQVIGPFHHCFSAVVGPNGSGKSNVIDAMLFVFGKRAKKLRLNKVSELIHSSSSQPKLKEAKVAVHVAEIVDTSPTTYEVVPGTATVIARTAKADNTSTYSLNGKNCQFRQVAEYLGSKGIDLDNNRFLILQGEVEMISMMPPKGKHADSDDGLLEYLEDIIGSSQFVPRAEEAAEKVEALSEQRQEKLNRVKAVQKEKESLSGAKEEAVALLRKDRQIRAQYNVLYQWLIQNCSIDEPNKRRLEVQAQLQSMKEESAAVNDRLDEIRGSVRKYTKLHDRVHKELTTTKEEFAEYERKDIKMKEEIKHIKAQKKKLEQKVAKQEETESKCREKISQATDLIPQLENQLVEQEEQKVAEEAALETIYADVKEVTQEHRAKLDEASQKLAPINQERAVLQGALDTAMTELQLLEDGVSRARSRLSDAEAELSTIDEQKSSKQQALKSSENELEETIDRLKKAEAEEKVLEQEEPKLATSYTEATSQAERAKSAFQASGGPRVNPAVASVLKASRKGGELEKAGIIGRLGDLATIPDNYDVAISTACGMLDNIVIRTSAGAAKCLEYLRKHNAGRASFICMDQLKKGAHDCIVETPENAPRLFDLLNPIRSEIAPALFLAVGNTLVAPDLDSASRWCYDSGKRWRVVTLDGKLFETSGTQSGGGNVVRRGKMKLASGRSDMFLDSNNEDAVKKFEMAAETIQRNLHQCRERRKTLSQEIRNLKKTAKSVEARLPKLSLEVDGCDTTKGELTKLIPELRTQCELSSSDARKAEGLRTKVQQCESKVSKCSETAIGLEEEVAKLQKSIMEAGGSKLKKQQALVEKSKMALKKTKKDISAAKVAVSSNEKSLAKAAGLKSSAESEFEQWEAKYVELKAAKDSLLADATKVAEDVDRVKALELEARQTLQAAASELDELEKSRSEEQCREVELEGQLEELEKQIQQKTSKIAKWNSELEKLRQADDGQDIDLLSDGEEEDGESGNNSNNDDSTTEDTDTMQIRKSSLPILNETELTAYDKEEVKKTISILETERNQMAQNANMGAIAEYRKKEEDYLIRVAELDAITATRNEARKEYDDLRRQRLDMFMDGFGQITLKLKEMYQMITLGGDAELELVDSLDPFSEGIVFSVRPPKKSWKNICNLSGGEKTLSSLALVFALHHFKPTPLYVMDEIDAALDFKNVSIVANYIKERTRNAQFIIISLRNNMFELADRLVGIYKTDNCTKSVTVDPRAYVLERPASQDGCRTPALSARKRNRDNTEVLSSRRIATGSGLKATSLPSLVDAENAGSNKM